MGRKRNDCMRILTLLLVITHASACATTINGRSQQIRIATDPADAIVRVDGVRVHDTRAPEVSRSHAHVVQVEQAGFESQSAEVSRHLSGVFWLNFLWGPAFVVGMVVDASTGAMWELEPDELNVALKPTAAP